MVNELVLSLPWLAASLFAAADRHYVVALACSFMFFLAGLRQVQNAFHYALGLPQAMGARGSALSALLLGPRYPWSLHRKALEIATPPLRKWIALELSANCVWIGAVFLLLDYRPLEYHVLAMALGQCLTAFFAVWTTHHGCVDRGPIARTIRNRFKATITYNMFYHFEHHTFPSVPTCKLPILARRIDESAHDLPLRHVY